MNSKEDASGASVQPVCSAKARAVDSAIHRSAMLLLHAEVKRLKHEIEMTLNENPELADGENCTLIRLKRALMEPNAKVSV